MATLYIMATCVVEAESYEEAEAVAARFGEPPPLAKEEVARIHEEREKAKREKEERDRAAWEEYW